MEISMRKILIAAAAGMTVAVFQSAAFAADAKLAQGELKEHGCLNCHDMDKKKVGPGYNEVAAKNKGKKVEELMASMKGKPVHKAALAKTNDESLKVMLEWILTK
jgi:cytochrome c